MTGFVFGLKIKLYSKASVLEDMRITCRFYSRKNGWMSRSVFSLKWTVHWVG